MSKKAIIVIAVFIGIVAGAVGMYIFAGGPGPAGPDRSMQAGAGTSAPARKVLYWKAPMDPTYIRNEPGKSPMGMDLVPVYEGEEDLEPGTVKIDPVTVQNIGVRTARAKSMELTKSIRTTGRVDYDEKRVHHLHTKVDGWIEKLYVDTTGEGVRKDDILLEIYSPKLVSAQEEYLLARRSRDTMAGVGRESIVDLSRRRLELWDVPAHQIKEIEETGQAIRTLHIHSPASGIVIEKPVAEGMYVKPGMNIYTIADISKVWVYVDIYEYELPWVRLGQVAEMTLASYPGRTFNGKVAFIYPYMEQKSRTNKVRLEFDNPGLVLKPDMYADVTLKSIVSKQAVAVPSEAVILSGERSIVIVSKGGGRFAPRNVVLGVEADGFYEVREGLSAGTEVVTSAQFLIDSESRLNEAVSKMLDAREGDAQKPMDHGGMDNSMDHGGMDHSNMEMDKSMEHDGMDHGNMKMEEPMDHGSMDHSGMDHSGMEDKMEHDGHMQEMDKPMDHGNMDHGGH